MLVYDRTGDPLALTALFVASKLVPAFAAPALTARLEPTRRASSLPAVYMAEAAVFATLALFADALLPPAVVLALESTAASR